MTSHDDYFLGNFETGEIWSKDGFYKFKFVGYIVSNFMGLLSLLNCLHLHYEENKQLKQALNELKEIGDYQAQRIQELNNENTHIKTTIQTMKNNERTALGHSVLQQLWEAIQ